MNYNTSIKLQAGHKTHELQLEETIFELILDCPDGEQRISSAQCDIESVQKKEDTLTVTWKNKSGITAVLVNYPGNEELLSQLTVENHGTATIKSVKYPIAARKQLATFDQLLMSSAWGDNIPRPSKTIHDVSTSPSIRFDQDYIRYEPDEIIYYYPAIMAMQYMVIHNQSQSFYLATYSTADETMTFHAKSLGKYSLELAVSHYPFIKTMETWQSPKCSIAHLGGGWHRAADLYRQHMQPQFLTPNYPQWMAHAYHGWAERMIKQESGMPNFLFSDIDKIYREMHETTGMNHLFLVGWHDNGHDTKFPRYLPCTLAGTEAELREGIRKVHALGGRVSLYTNARLIDIYEEFYANGGKEAVSIDEAGKEYHEDYHTQSLYAVSCPGCETYSNHMAQTAKRICSDYGADGMFVDQISCNLDPFCYNEAHSHTKPSNNFLPGVEKELTAIKQATDLHNVDFHLFAEGCHERFNQFYAVNQGHGEEYTWQIGESLPEQFLYTFPDRIVTGMCGDKQQMYHAMAQFKPLDIKTECREDESNLPQLKQYISLRSQKPGYFFNSRFIDDEGFIYQEGIKLFAVKPKHGGYAVCLWSPGADESTENAAWLQPPDGVRFQEALPFSPTQVHAEGSWLYVKWTGALTYLVLE